ncbi:hypothetical protein [Streptacidiphilus cavernicola]|uniref:Delta-aminolevulinic acid dehydratase n=1 Tax=Streptacidiphilus cavernicola TaxID=3342716 RepID=A0ABV6VNX3_9ACTN
MLNSAPPRFMASAAGAYLAAPPLSPEDLTMVLLVRQDKDSADTPMPTVTVGEIPGVVRELAAVGIHSVKIFAGARRRDRLASGALKKDSLMVRAIGAAKEPLGSATTVLTETCLCGYTDSGNCYVTNGSGMIAERRSVEAIAAQAAVQAAAGADIVGPAAMLPGCTEAVRSALDEDGHGGVGIMPHLIFSSSLYQGFRSTMHAEPRDGRPHQISPFQPSAALASALQMTREGADVVLLEPALASADLVPALTGAGIKVAPFSVSGEYLSLTRVQADGTRDCTALVEVYQMLKRSGAVRIITYAARDIARVLHRC